MLPFILIAVVTMAISFYASSRVKVNYRKYSQIPAQSGYTGAEASHAILKAAGIRDVEVTIGEGMLGDHYDPTHKRLVLSPDNYHGSSVAALGIAAHECGHAIQHQAAYAPLTWRMASVGITSYASQIVLWLPIVGAFTGMFASKISLMLIAIGWGIIMLFNLITLPVEFDASRRAKIILGKMQMISSGPESEGVNKVLNAAAWTYVAAFITSLVYMLYYLLPLLWGRRD